MKNNIFRVFAILVLLLTTNGCNKDGTTDPTPPTPVVTGDLMGTVQPKDENGQNIADKSGVTVSIEGTTLSATTDASGNYSIKKIEEGSRVVVFSKSGCGTYKKKIAITGNHTNQLGSISIYELPAFYVQNLSATVISGAFELSGTLTNKNSSNQSIVIFAYTDNSVSSDTSKYLFSSDTGVYSSQSTFAFSISFGTLIGAGFKSGQMVYFVAYSSVQLSGSDTHYFINSYKEGFYFLGTTPSNKVNVAIP
ncbi:MAG: carboxypeptidase-like regulatory domain-containing protein [Ignavibacteriaceae bacterium]